MLVKVCTPLAPILMARSASAIEKSTSCMFTAAIRSGTTIQSAYAPARNESARHCSPRTHPSHSPHGAEFAATTRRPSTIPQNSCPNGAGDSLSSSGCPRRNVFRSVPSVRATSISTSTSPGPGSGRGTSSTRRSPGAYSRAAFTG